MRKLRSTIIGLSLMFSATAANAVVIDFAAMAQASGSHGESAWTSLDFSFTEFDLSITGVKGGESAYAYLDAGHGGLGVCGEVNDVNKIDQVTNSSSYLCTPRSDDSVTPGETLKFDFSQDVTIEKIWFNNNHDGDRSLLTDSITIGGSTYTFTNGGSYQDSYTLSSYDVSAHSIFDISYFDEQFYVSKMLITVPAPGALALMGLGLLGLVAARRKVDKTKIIA